MHWSYVFLALTQRIVVFDMETRAGLLNTKMQDFVHKYFPYTNIAYMGRLKNDLIK